MILNLATVLSHKLLGKKTDFFLDYKYTRIQHHYGEVCLDVGTGTGRFAEYLKSKGKKVETIDIVDKCTTNLPFKIFNGRDIPFASKSIDTSLLFFVLHHTDDQVKLLRECQRVTRKTIIIGEDIIENTFDRIMGKIHLGTSPWSRSENGFKTNAQWTKLFDHLGFKILAEVTISRAIYPIYPIARKIYVLGRK